MHIKRFFPGESLDINELYTDSNDIVVLIHEMLHQIAEPGYELSKGVGKKSFVDQAVDEVMIQSLDKLDNDNVQRTNTVGNIATTLANLFPDIDIHDSDESVIDSQSDLKLILSKIIENSSQHKEIVKRICSIVFGKFRRYAGGYTYKNVFKEWTKTLYNISEEYPNALPPEREAQLKKFVLLLNREGDNLLKEYVNQKRSTTDL